jgi:putative ABC transport system permease protein
MIALLRVLSLAPLRARARRSVLAILAIAVGVALGLAVNLVNDAALTEMQQALRTVSGEADIRLEGVSRTMDETLYGKIGLRREIESIAPVIELEVAVAGRREPLKIMGLDPFASARFTPQLLTRPDATAGDPLANFGGARITVSPAVLAWLQDGNQPATHLPLATPRGQRTLEISGVLAGIESRQRVAVLDIATAQELFNLQGEITRLDLRLMPGVDRTAFINDIARALPAGVHAVAPEVREQQAAALSRAYRVNLTMLAMVALFSGALLVYSTQMLSVAERVSELAFLRVIGVTARETVGLMLFEAVLLGAAGALLGAALGYALAWGALQVLGGDLGAGYFHGTRPTLVFAPWTTLLFVLSGGGAAMLGALIPALAAARAHPAPALKTGALNDAANEGPAPALGGGLCAASALLTLAPAINGIPVFGYIAISGMLIGAILLTPAICARLFRRVERYLQTIAFAPATLQLALARLVYAPAQAGISLAAVLAAVSLAGAMAIMVTSFRHSVEDWLEQVLPAPAYLRQKTPEQTKSQGYFDAAAQAVIRTTPGVMRAEFMRTEALTLDPARPPVALVIREFGDAAADQPDKRLPLVKRFPTPASPAPLAPPVWVSESFLDLYRGRLHLDSGGTFAFDLPLPMNPNGATALRVRVAGVWRDYSRQHGAVLINLTDYARVTGDPRARDAALWISAGVTATALLAALKSRLPALTALDLAETADVRALTLKIFDRTFAVTYALEAVAVLIGLAGMVAAFTGLIVARKKEFGMLRHVGLTRRELTRMLTLEGAALAALGALLGLGLGVILAAILVFVINPQSFGWSMDFHLPALQLAAFSATLIVAAAVAAWVSARRVIGEHDVVLSVREDW